MIDKLQTYKPTKDYSIPTYNDEQKHAIDVLVDFINSDEDYDYTLDGPGGSGKTTIMIDVLRFCKRGGKRAVSAPTHKAVRVIGNSTGMSGQTIHKLLGLRPDVDLDNFDPNKPMFNPLGNPSMGDYSVVVIDEASMINKWLYERIVRTASRTNTKVIFAGDECQAPPVGEQLSLVFKSPRKVSLNMIMRQGDDHVLIPLLNILRQDIKLGSSYFFTALRKAPKMEFERGGYYMQDGANFVASMSAYFNDKAFERNIDFVRTTCFTNNAVAHWNGYVRENLFPDVTDILCKDDLLMSYSTIVEKVRGDKIIEIMVNSEDYIINDFNRYVNDQGLQGFLVSLKAITSGDITPFMFILDHKHQESVNKYAAILQAYINPAVGARNVIDRRIAWETYYKYRNKNLCMIDIYKPDGKTLLTSKDLDYGFAITVHKTQGSTYNNIFIDGNNIIYNKFGVPVKDIKLRNRLLYVALSRPKENAFININI